MSSVAILRAAGLTDAQIVKVKELEEAERKAARKEQNRKAQQNHRARKQISADAADQNGKVQQNQTPCQHFSASNADMADAPPTQPIVEQNQQPSQQISADHADKPDILSSSFLLSSSGEPLKKGSASKKVSSGGARYSDEFEKFWLPYPRTPIMGKKETFAEWLKLSPEDRTKATSAVPAYRKFLAETPNPPTTIHASRFLSKRRFDGFAEAQAPPTNGAGPLPGSPAWRKIHGWPAEGLPGDEINPRLDLADSEPEDQGVLRGIAKVHRGDAGGEPQFADGSDHGLWMS